MNETSLEIQVYYEIAMSIGNSRDLRRMLRESLSTYLRKLNCCAGVVLYSHQINDDLYELDIVCSIPRSYDITDFLSEGNDSFPLRLNRVAYDSIMGNLPDYGDAGNGRKYHVMELAGFGLLLLVKSGSFINRPVLKSLIPLNLKLARACISCLQDARLKREILERQQTEFELNRHREHLEDLVKERTRDLTIANEELVGEISERIKAVDSLRESEKRLAESEALMKTIFNGITDPIMVVDRQRSVVMANKKLLETRGISSEEAIAGQCYQVYNGIDEKCFPCVSEKTFKTGEPQNEIRIFLDKDGEKRQMEVYSFPIFSEEGNVDRVIELGHDITARETAKKEREKLEADLMRVQKMESIGTLAGGIAHDFNNILMGILGNLALACMDAGQNEGLTEKLKNIENYVNSGRALTSQLLGFARGGKYEVEVLDLNEFIKESIQLFSRTKKEITIKMDLQDDVWPIEVDRGQLNQVLLNLYVNAWQAMEGSGEIFLETLNVVIDENEFASHGLPGGRYVRLTVRDTGEGMSEEVALRVFDPFFTTKEKGHGTGLGLAAAYGIIRNHNGVIKVESRQGHGATFMIFLPASNRKVEKTQLNKPEMLQGDETLLVVDDEEMILDVVTKMLKHLGYKIFSVMNGAEAVEFYKTHQDEIDLVILDMIMPGMNGSETFDRLKQIDPSVKVLLSSGYSLDGEASAILQRGCDGFIQKAFDMYELSIKIREILDK